MYQKKVLCNLDGNIMIIGKAIQMKIKSHIIKILTAVFIMTLFNNINDITKVYASENNMNEMDILLIEDADIQKVSTLIKSLNSHIEITEYNEIKLIHIEYPGDIDEDVILNNDDIKKYIDVSGTLPEIVAEPIDVDSIAENGAISEGVDLDDATKLVNDQIFDRLSWHVNEVTNNKKSLELATGKDIKVAIIDSGVDYNHPYLKGKINLNGGKSYVDDDSSLYDYNTHGTMIAGIIAQLAPDVTITPYKVLGETTGESLWTINAIIDAVNDGNEIINMSLGTYKYTKDVDEKLTINAYKRAIRYAKNRNVIVVASAGNYSLDLDNYNKINNILHLPGGVDDVYTVSSVNNDKLASYSNHGKCVDFCAPGGEIVYVNGYLNITSFMYVLYPTYRDNGLASLGIPQGYTFSYGTSLSTAIVTAGLADIASYCKENYNFYKVSDVENILKSGAKDIGNDGQDPLYGIGKIDIYNSLKKANEIVLGKMEKDDEKSYSYNNDVMSINYVITAEYDENYHVDVTVTNNTDETINNWEIAYNTDDEIQSIWNGQASIRDGYTIVKNNEYNQDINPGGKVSFGYIAVKKDEIKIPSEFIFTNYYLVTPSSYEVSYNIDSQWSNGYIATVTITNTSDVTIEDWKLEFEFADNIDTLWGAEILNVDDEKYTIINSPSNNNILAKECTSFSFKVSESNGGIEPCYYELLSTVNAG